MDPTSNMTEQVRLANRLLTAYEDQDFAGFVPRAARLAELVEALNEWMTKGGFKPAQWCLHDGKKP